MAWEGRKRGGRYYTRSRRIDGQVTREYVGIGPDAEQAANHDRLERAQHRATRAEEHRVRALTAAADAPVIQLHTLVEIVARCALLASGFYRHHGGEWRRRRDE